ncbi:MAG: monovalent cation/H(+) antiporter subunit G [Puniceicoccaceae bacterium]
MIEIIASLVLLTGAVFAFIAALGMVRMPDLFCRMHAATKAGAFGASLIVLAVILFMPQLRVIIQGILIVLFFYLTAPVAAHMIARVALLRKAKD